MKDIYHQIGKMYELDGAQIFNVQTNLTDDNEIKEEPEYEFESN
jgi:hypothetical protein